MSHLKPLSFVLLALIFGACSQVTMLEGDGNLNKENDKNKDRKEQSLSTGGGKTDKVIAQQAVSSETNRNNQAPNKVDVRDEDSLEKVSDSDQVKAEKRSVKEKTLAQYCKKLQKNFTKYGWGKSSCENYPWKFVRTSVNGDPLLWRTFGRYSDQPEKTETTLIMCGVHGDEITPIKFCYDIIDYLEKVSRGEVKDNKGGEFVNLEGKYVIVAPLVNPDSYFKRKPTRTNANGVDVNRNLPTKDFKKKALSMWKNYYGSDKRRYPGQKAMSEPETIFQVNLIYRYQPDKIISVHSPLTMLDYDGPASAHTGGMVGSRANQLLIKMSEEAKGYRIKNYPFFPGSLGNYAGNERNIPTYTLELPTSNPAKSSTYWRLFKTSIHEAIMHEISGEGFVALDDEELKELEATN